MFATLETLKQGYDLAKEAGVHLGPLENLKHFLGERKERRAMLQKFSTEFPSHKIDETYVMDYYSWTKEAQEWYLGDGEVFAMSVRETSRWWSDPHFYALYDAALTKFVKRGGEVNRIMVVENEFVDLGSQLTFLKTCYRHSLLGMEPLVIYHPDTWSVLRDLGVDCDLFGCANNRIAYFNRLDGEPLCVKSYSKKYVEKAYATYRNLMRRSKRFEEWITKVSWGHLPRPLMKEVEKEAAVIEEYAYGA